MPFCGVSLAMRLSWSLITVFLDILGAPRRVYACCGSDVRQFAVWQSGALLYGAMLLQR